MIMLDSDVLIDLLRKHPPAVAWFDALQEDDFIPGIQTVQPYSKSG